MDNDLSQRVAKISRELEARKATSKTSAGALEQGATAKLTDSSRDVSPNPDKGLGADIWEYNWRITFTATDGRTLDNGERPRPLVQLAWDYTLSPALVLSQYDTGNKPADTRSITDFNFTETFIASGRGSSTWNIRYRPNPMGEGSQTCVLRLEAISPVNGNFTVNFSKLITPAG